MKHKKSASAIVLALALAALGWWLYSSGNLPFVAQQDQDQQQHQRPPTQVDVTQATRGTIEVRVRGVGTIVADEQITVTAETAGIVDEINFREGEVVEQDRVLVRLDTERQRARLAAAEARYREARRQLDRFQGLETGVVVSQARLDEIRAQAETAEAETQEARAILDDAIIRAPFRGRIGLRQVSPGALIQPGTPITTLTTMENLKVQFDLPADLLPRLRLGLPVRLRPGMAGGQTDIEARIERIDTIVNSATRTVTIEAAIEGKAPETLLPGVFSVVDVTLERRENIVLPEESIVLQGSSAYVFVLRDNDQIERREVQVGQRRPGEAEILAGVDQGERIVVRGVQKVQAGQSVQPNPASQTAEELAAPPPGAGDGT